jgi:hypothetical protein
MADKKISQLPASTVPLAGTEELAIVQSGDTKKVATDNLTVKNLRSNATTGILQVVGPAVGTTRVMTTPNANFTAARTDAAQTFTGEQTFSGTSGSTVTASGTIQGVINIKRSNVNGTLLINGGSGSFQIYDGDANKFVVQTDASQNWKLNVGNLVIGTAGKGIDFSADGQAAGMTSELLDDYEEGTWTPVVTSTTGTITSYTSEGRYTKIGRQVEINFQFLITDNGTGSAVINVTGLPFEAGNTLPVGSFAEVSAVGFQAVGILINTTNIRIYKYDWTYPGGTNYRVKGTLVYEV